jgi:RNA polymerase primary sigma factor
MNAAKKTTHASKATQSRDALRIYFKEISKFPLLTVPEEQELGRAIQQGDEAAVKTLVESNLRFVVKFAKRYRQGGLSFLDLINEGNLGLIEAAKRFDPAKNVRFISYAVWWIRQSIVTSLSRFRRPFKLPIKLNATLYKMGINLANRTNGIDDKPTMVELAVEVGATQGELRWILEGGGEGISLNQPLTREGDAGLEEFLIQTRIPSPEQEVVRRSMRKSLKKLLEPLGEREQQILKLRYGLEDDTPLVLQQIGEKLGLSRERVRQIEEEALKKLRQQHDTLSFMNEVSLLTKIVAARQPSY